MNAFPNLMSAENYLAQSLLGESWMNYVGCSRFSIFWRASRLNHLTKSEVRSVLGVSLRANENPFDKLTHTQASPRKLLNLSPGNVIDPTHWPLEFWWPFGGLIPWDVMPWRLRICPACARHCYHSMLFQTPGVHHCPWHQVALIDACPRCDRPLSSGSLEGLPTGLCPCGYDLVNYVETIGGDSTTSPAKQDVIVAYGTWAAASRRINYLIGPKDWDARAWQALHALRAPIPDALLPGQHARRNAPSGELLLERVPMGRSLRLDECRLSPESRMESPRSSVISLPSTWKNPLSHIGEKLTRMLPPSALKRLVSDPSLRHSTRHLSIFPGINSVYLHTECLDPSTLDVLSRLASTMPEGRQRLKEEADSIFLQALFLGDTLIERTIYRVLTRSYADGAWAMLGRHAPELYDNDRWKPKIRLPWTVICLPPKLTPSARIAWTLRPGTD